MKLNFVLGYTNEAKEHYAVAVSFPTNSNLFYCFGAYEKDKYAGDLDIIQHVTSKKKAEELARFWNKCYKDNGTLNKFFGGK